MPTLPFVLLAFGLGVVAGLRTFTPPFLLAWAIRFGWLDVRRSGVAFLGAPAVPWVLTALALFELVVDVLPTTPSRTVPWQFAARLCSGGFCGAVLAAGTGHAFLWGELAGVAGAVVGTLGGYRARTGLRRALRVPDVAIALPEDVVAIGGGFVLLAAVLR